MATSLWRLCDVTKLDLDKIQTSLFLFLYMEIAWRIIGDMEIALQIGHIEFAQHNVSHMEIAYTSVTEFALPNIGHMGIAWLTYCVGLNFVDMFWHRSLYC